MAILTRDALLGASDLIEREIELPSLGGSVRVRSLPAAYSNQANSDAMEMLTGPRGEQTTKVDTQRLQELKVLHGVIEPKFNTIDEVRAFSLKVGAAWDRIVEAIDEISGINKDAIEKTSAIFRSGGSDETGKVVGDEPAAGNGRSDLPVRTGARAAHVGGGDRVADDSA